MERYGRTGDRNSTTVALQFPRGSAENPGREAIAALTDDVLHERGYLLEPLLERYMQWVWQSGREQLRSSYAYTHDILTFGVLWRCYGTRAAALPAPFAWGMSGLGRLREVIPNWRPAIDRVRSWLAAPLLGPRFGDVDARGIPSRCETRALLSWMDATGEFTRELPRLCQFRAFLDRCDRYEREWYLAQLSAFTARFGMMAAHRMRSPEAKAEAAAGTPHAATASEPAQEVADGPVVHTEIESVLARVGRELQRRATHDAAAVALRFAEAPQN